MRSLCYKRQVLLSAVVRVSAFPNRKKIKIKPIAMGGEGELSVLPKEGTPSQFTGVIEGSKCEGVKKKL